ncbi:pH-response regulator protein palA/rim20 [Rhizophlyctis rosea]|uniref:PH-response regulator protein palA/rim20 n=1 Tax=Rhizophlyctis rosea TaxID=64517 RepID=A0AAD5SAG2_9FUNG|nr:pH-response regulator protein palA/rim20 [Rhizophlyctis rosea]
MASTNMLAVDFKRTERLSLAPPIKSYIQTAYAEDPDQYIDDFRALEALRGDIVVPDVHQASLNKLLKYYGQLCFLGGKFPIDENHIKICFLWHQVLAKEKKSVSSFSINFEKAGVLFNTAAMYSQLGVKQERGTAEGIKKACQYFQQAAGIFKFLLENLAEWNVPQIGDLQASILETLTNMMLGQAQECFWHKAVVDKLKDAIVAKLAMQAATFYETASQSAEGSGAFDKTWTTHLQVKKHHFNAAAQYRGSAECKGAGRYGEEIARLQLAQASVKKGMEHYLFKHALPHVQGDMKVTSARIRDGSGSLLTKHVNQNLQQMIENELRRAEKDNDIVYMEVVPRVETLVPIKGAVMVQATPLPTPAEMGDIVGTPVFSKLVPYAVHAAASLYSSKKDSLVKSEISKLEEATALCQSTLASMNLPSAIEALEQPIGLPPALLQRSQEVRNQGGARGLNDQWQTATTLGQKDAEILDEAVRILDDEAKEDEELRVQFRERWGRTPSKDLTNNLRDTVRNFRNKLEAAKKADQLVRGKIDTHIHFIESLSLTKEELEASIPSSTASSTLALKDPNVKELKTLLQQLTALLNKRQPLIDDVKKTSGADDIGAKLAELSIHGNEINEEAAFADQLQRYDPFASAVRESIAEQENLLNGIRSANSRFVESKQTNEMIRQREQALQNLDNAFKFFGEISKNLQEGIKFYTDFQNVLTKFRDNCKDYAFSRNVDKKDYLAQLQQSITNVPALPPRHGGGGGGYPNASPATGTQTGYPGMPPPGGIWNPNQAPQFGPGPYGAAPPGQLFYSSVPPQSMPPPLNGQQPPNYGGYGA